VNVLAVDCETGGTNPLVHSLLTAYFLVMDENFNVIDELDLKLKPSNPALLNVCQEAMNVTCINLEQHLADPQTLTYEEGCVKLTLLLEKHKIKGKRSHYRLLGQNVEFDRNFILNQLISDQTWNKYVNNKPLDTLRIVTFLQDIGFLPTDLGRLESLVEFFKLPKGEAHTAKDDTKMTVEVYKCLRQLIMQLKSNVGSFNNSLLEIIER
jgi:DNA polymerase III epsilon subunit-like protein